MEKVIYDERTVFGTNCKAIITFPASSSPKKNSSLSGRGDNGIYDI